MNVGFKMAAGWMGVSRGGGLLARPVYDTAPIRRTSDEVVFRS